LHAKGIRLKFSQSLKNNYEFRRLYVSGKSAVSPHIAVYKRKNKNGINRLGLTVGKKVGNAVNRNRVRRRLKEIYRLHEDEFLRGYDIVVVARVKSRYAAFGTLETDMLRLFKKLSLTKPDKS